jgi:hypothetical protein
MRGALFVEREPRAIVTDQMNTGNERVDRRRRRRRALASRPLPIGVVGRMRLVLREGVEDIGEHQFLMLLLVMQSDLDDRGHRFEIVRGLDQRGHGRVDVGAVRGRFNDTRPRYKAALRPLLPRARRHVIRVEQIGEALVEHAIARYERTQQKMLEEPGHVGAVPLDRARVRHRLHDLILGAERRGAALRLSAHRAEGVEPITGASEHCRAQPRHPRPLDHNRTAGKAAERDIVWSENRRARIAERQCRS